MKRSLTLATAVLALFSPIWANAEVERIELFQRAEVMAQQQRLVGNLRAVARREGVVVNVPQLYVFHYDFSEAFHQEGYRRGFERELDLVVGSRRGARSMVRLDRLLERVKTPDGADFALTNLPEADVFIALYRRANCAECDQVAEHLEEWISGNPERRVVWLDVRTDAVRQ
ncbi:MAG: hypothetical protein ACXIUM_13760 [Wenzhouxiangella sp.]